MYYRVKGLGPPTSRVQTVSQGVNRNPHHHLQAYRCLGSMSSQVNLDGVLPPGRFVPIPSKRAMISIP
jgi:hypothetical protein